ncbi:ABC transporter substrate-binding protein [Cytobacillus kochii]|uniref:ABC transporter substrate-binding protein n=1 Tax=Cytobacillus kochii TaxID=859143 RepID=UPI00402AF2F8
MFLSHKKKNLLLIATITTSLALFGCGNEDAENSNNDSNQAAEQTEDRVLTDALGNEITIPANPERVVATYLEDHLVALGITPIVQWSVANGKQEYLQEYLKDVPTIAHDLPLEAVSSQNPDLIIMDGAGMVEGGKYDQYAKIAPTYVIGEEENSDWRTELETVGEIFGKEDKATEVLKEYEDKAAQVEEELQKDHAGESAAAIWLVNNSLFVVSKDLSAGDVIYNDLGMAVPSVVEEISADATGNWSAISLEKLADMDVDHLFFINSDGEGAEVLSDPLWANIPAVKNENVYEFSRDTGWLYTGTIANTQIIEDVEETILNK